MSTFPFTIGDVAHLCHLNICKENRQSEYIVCPFCGRKKMNLHYGKGLYHCPACGEGGSMLKLYAELRGFQGSKGEIVKEIKKELGITKYSYYHFSTKTDKPEEKPKPQVDFERMKRLDTVYRAFLGKLFLARIHKQDLIERGLDDADIERFGFKSVPLFGYKAICRELIQDNVCLEVTIQNNKKIVYLHKKIFEISNSRHADERNTNWSYAMLSRDTKICLR